MNNPKKKKINPKSLANLRPPFQIGNKQAVGHGRPRIYSQEKAIKQANYEILNAMVQTGIYYDTILEVIEKQTAKGQMDAIKWIYENAIGSTVLPPTGQEMLDNLEINIGDIRNENKI